jgi:hypothetical protein
LIDDVEFARHVDQKAEARQMAGFFISDEESTPPA